MSNVMKINTQLLDKPEVVTEDYCISVFNTGKSLQGYALWLAKEEVHRDSQTGWEKFCDKVGVSKSNANALIGFYEAQNRFASESIPDNASTYKELRGSTPEEKAQNYAEIKKSTGKEKPTRQDIRDHNSMMKKLTQAVQSEMSDENDFNDWLDQQPGWENDRALRAYASFGVEMLHTIPEQVQQVFSHASEWKKMYRKIAKVLHPDNGGSDEEMQFLTALNTLMETGVKLYEAPIIKKEIEEMRVKYAQR